MRDMSDRKNEYQNKGVEILAVNAFEDNQQAKDWIASTDLSYSWAFANTEQAEALGVKSVPTQIILDTDGKVLWTSSMISLFGGADEVYAQLDNAL